jgi:hypothetical protein
MNDASSSATGNAESGKSSSGLVRREQVADATVQGDVFCSPQKADR